MSENGRKRDSPVENGKTLITGRPGAEKLLNEPNRIWKPVNLNRHILTSLLSWNVWEFARSARTPPWKHATWLRTNYLNEQHGAPCDNTEDKELDATSVTCPAMPPPGITCLPSPPYRKLDHPQQKQESENLSLWTTSTSCPNLELP